MDKYEQRRKALRALVDELGRGGISAVAQKIGKESSYVSRMLYPEGKNGKKRIGEDTVELLQKAYPEFFGHLASTADGQLTMALGKRIRHYREKAGLTLEELSERSGVDVGTISALENRDSSRSKYATAIARGLGMTLEMLEKEGEDFDVKTLLTGIMEPAPAPVGVPLYTREAPPDGYVRLPVMAEASAGPGRAPLLEAVRPVDVLESYIRQKLNANPRNLEVLTARGNSMTGLIEDGDIMFVMPTKEFTEDGIYILTLDDFVRVKRLSISMASGSVVIESNDGRRAEEVPLKEASYRLHIQGRVVGSWSIRSFP